MKQKIISQSHSFDWQIDFIINIEVTVSVYSPLSTFSLFAIQFFFLLIDNWWSRIRVFVWSECNLELRAEKGLTYFPIKESLAFHFFLSHKNDFFFFHFKGVPWARLKWTPRCRFISVPSFWIWIFCSMISVLFFKFRFQAPVSSHLPPKPIPTGPLSDIPTM